MFLGNRIGVPDRTALGGGGGQTLTDFALDGTNPDVLFSPRASLYHDGEAAEFADLATFSRSGTATYYDSEGILQTAADGVARTDAHRYVEGQWVRGGLLLETEARTNLCTSSSDFDGPQFSDQNNLAEFLQEGDGPRGTGTMFRMQKETESALGLWIDFNPGPVSTSTWHTVSCYARKGSLTWFMFWTVGFTSPANGEVYFDLENGVVGTEDGPLIGDIEQVGPDLYRVSMSFLTDSSDTTGSIRFGGCNGDGDRDAPSGPGHVFIDHLQFEQGSKPSSPIFTDGSTATRSAESVVMPAAAAGHSSTAMTYRFTGALTYEDVGSNNAARFFYRAAETINDGEIVVNVDTSGGRVGEYRVVHRAAGSDVASFRSEQITPGVNKEVDVIGRWTNTDVSVVSNGTVFGTDAAPSAAPAVADRDLAIGDIYMGYVETLAIWNGPYFSNDQLEGGSTPPAMPEAMINWYAPGSSATATQFDAVGTHDVRFVGPVLAPNGLVYCPPWHGDAAVARFDPAANTVNNTNYGLDFLESDAFEDMQAGQYLAGCYASDGKIYYAPWGEDEFLVINPVANTAIKTDFGQSIGAYDSDLFGIGITGGNAHSYGLVEGPNQKLYSIPYSLNRSPVIIDLDTQTASLASYANIKTGTAFQLFELWNGGALAPNGKIYCSPYERADEVLVIDTSDDTATLETFGLTLTGSYQFGQPCLGPDGKIYMPPYNRDEGLIIDPDNETAVLEDWGLDLSEGYGYYSATVGPDGKIYCPPSFATTGWLVIDPIANTASFEDLGTSNGINFVMPLPDGRMLAMQGSDTSTGFGGSSSPSARYWIIDVSGAAGPAVSGFADDLFTIWHPR